jgi:hypothetical protein
MAVMRAPLPLDDHDFADIRAQVMARIETPRRAPLWRVAFAALTLALLSIVVGRLPAARPSPGASRHPLPLPRERGAEVAVAPPSPLRLTREREAIALVAPLPRAGEGAAKRRVRVAHHHKPSVPQLARIEIQTADPDVRIIWITN